jgi:hypothetical protein
MRTNPISDAFDFLTQRGWTSYVFWALGIASIVTAAVNLRRDSSQCSILHLWNWLARFFYRRDVVAAVLVEAASRLH